MMRDAAVRSQTSETAVARPTWIELTSPIRGPLTPPSRYRCVRGEGIVFRAVCIVF